MVSAICLACALMPFRCNLTLGDTQRVWDDGGPLFGGVAAVLFAMYALLRRRAPLGGRGRMAVALTTLGTVSAIYGYLTIKRVYPGPELSPLAERVESQLVNGEIDELIAEADPMLKVGAPLLREKLAPISKRLHDHLLVESENYWEWGPGGVGFINSISEFDGAGAFMLRMTFRENGDVPRLVSLDVVPRDAMY